MTDRDLPEALADLPVSAELVYRLILELDEPTQADIAGATPRPRRTVRYALTRLDEAGLVTTRPSTRDARQDVYEPVSPTEPE